MEKSAAFEAYFPSFPSIPIPTSDTYIIPTSFPPSPIAQVIYPVHYLIPNVNIAFYLGEHRQQITAGALLAMVKINFFIFSFDVAVAIVFPSIIRTVSCLH